jgi:hypothetical protein
MDDVFQVVADAVTNGLHVEAVKGNVVTVGLWLTHWPHPHACVDNHNRDEREWALVGASKHGRLRVVERLLLLDDIDPAYDHNRAVSYAAKHGCLLVVACLLRDSRVDPADNDSLALRWAAKNGHADVVALLLRDARCDPSANDQQAVYDAAHAGHDDVVEKLMTDARTDASARDNRALRAAVSGHHRAVVARLLLDARVTPSGSLLLWAVRTNALRVVAQLLRDPRVDDAVSDPFMYALKTRACVDMITLLALDSRTTLTHDHLVLLDTFESEMTPDLLTVLSTSRVRAPRMTHAIARRRDTVRRALAWLCRSPRAGVCRDVVHAFVHAYVNGARSTANGECEV